MHAQTAHAPLFAIQVSVPGGGHNLDHAALRDGVLLIDVTGLNKEVDRETKKARGTQHTYAHTHIQHPHTQIERVLSFCQVLVPEKKRERQKDSHHLR